MKIPTIFRFVWLIEFDDFPELQLLLHCNFFDKLRNMFATLAIIFNPIHCIFCCIDCSLRFWESNQIKVNPRLNRYWKVLVQPMVQLVAEAAHTCMIEFDRGSYVRHGWTSAPEWPMFGTKNSLLILWVKMIWVRWSDRTSSFLPFSNLNFLWWLNQQTSLNRDSINASLKTVFLKNKSFCYD